ncbi:uncharacterized protein LOC144493386 isoform X1 [Mustelus asterias]
MLRLFLTVSFLFWNQLAAQNQELNEFCYQIGCPVPSKIIQHETYAEVKFHPVQWIETQVDSMDALQTGLEKLFNYSHFGNDAGTIVPLTAPWGIAGILDSGKLSPRFRVYIPIAPEVNNPPEPTNQEVSLGSMDACWYFVRAFVQKVEVEQYAELMTEFLKDLEQDNQNVERSYFDIAFYSIYDQMEMAFMKTGE